MSTDSTPPSKDTIWQTGWKKIQLSVVYKRPALLTEINTGLGWKTRRYAKPPPPKKQGGIAILISDKVDFKLTLVKWDKEGHFILTKRAINPKGNNNYQPICTQCQCTLFHQTYSEGFKGHIDSNTVVVGDSSLNNKQVIQTKDQQRNPRTKWHHKPNDLTDVYKVFYQMTAKYTFFSAAHGTFFKIDHILGHKACLP
jgi:hypothetical protein